MRVRFWRPALSLVVVVYNMPREARRTLYSLSTRYQRGISEGEYEVIVVDNGSLPPFPAAEIAELAGRFEYVYMDPAPPSPAPAINLGLQRARGHCVGVMIDGARIASPGLLYYALRSFRAFRDPVVTALAWHLGPDIQRRAVEQYGYDQAIEDRLLERIRWPADGYRLFEIASLAGSSQGGWFAPKSESSSLFLRRASFERLGGYDERFDEPGGGLVNADTYIRACELPDSELVLLLGESTFHQMHGGVMTGAPEDEARRKMAAWMAQYEAIRKIPLLAPKKVPHYLGHIPAAALPSLFASAAAALGRREHGAASDERPAEAT